MSQRREISLTCPQCGKEYPFIIWNSINTTLNPEMKEAVKDRSAFRFVCPDCGAKTYVDYDLLYHQMEDRIIEIYKIFILHTVQEKDPDCKDIEMLYYKEPTEGKDFIQIIADGKTYGVVELKKSTYDELYDEYRDRLPDIRKDGPYIDRSWALEKMKTWTRS